MNGQGFGTPLSVGTWIDDATLKVSTFTPAMARYVKITALSEAGNRGQWSSMADVQVYTGTAPGAKNTGGSWDLTIDFPLVPVSMALEATTGRLLVWSSYAASTFGGGNGMQTLTAVYDPASQLVTSTTVTNTGHDMFCIGLSMDVNGQVIAVGGNTDAATSVYNSQTNGWTAGGVSRFRSFHLPLENRNREDIDVYAVY